MRGLSTEEARNRDLDRIADERDRAQRAEDRHAQSVADMIRRTTAVMTAVADSLDAGGPGSLDAIRAKLREVRDYGDPLFPVADWILDETA